jgi:hypothetical protein
MNKGPGNPYHDSQTGEFTSGPGGAASGHNAGGGNRNIAKAIKNDHKVVAGVNDKSVTDRYVYAAINHSDARWKVWGEAKVAGSPVTFTEDVYKTKQQAIKAIGSYAKNALGWKPGSYFKSIDE